MTNSYTIIKNKSVLVTGGTTGIGRATAKLLYSLGARVMIFGRDEIALKEAVAAIKSEDGGEIVGRIADVSNKQDVEQVFREFDAKFGKIDILINNAALPIRSITNTPYEKWKYVIDVNISGYLLCAQFALERMLSRNDGHIVNIGSMSSKVREEDADVYVATKSAIEGFSESLRKQVNKKDIKVTVIEPGSVGSDMTRETPEEQRMSEEQLLMLKAEDIAEAILFCLTRPKRANIICLEIKPLRQII